MRALPDDGGSTYLRNIGQLLPDYTPSIIRVIPDDGGSKYL
jgi:hypothetical protein